MNSILKIIFLNHQTTIILHLNSFWFLKTRLDPRIIHVFFMDPDLPKGCILHKSNIKSYSSPEWLTQQTPSLYPVFGGNKDLKINQWWKDSTDTRLISFIFFMSNMSYLTSLKSLIFHSWSSTPLTLRVLNHLHKNFNIYLKLLLAAPFLYNNLKNSRKCVVFVLMYINSLKCVFFFINSVRKELLLAKRVIITLKCHLML